MGSDRHYPEEAPAHFVKVDGFWIDRRPVTNREFQDFVEATGYVTFAEIPPDAKDYPGALPEMLHPASLVFTPPGRPVDLRDCSNWWVFRRDASWRQPYGPGSSIEGKDDHPVVHVAYKDVEAFAVWAKREIPTEAEWEYAARGGLEDAEYAWGNDLKPDGKLMANFWQGEFPWQNLGLDGFAGTSPVGSFAPNGYGLHDMTGNVWEWTADFFTPAHVGTDSACCAPRNRRVSAPVESVAAGQPGAHIPRRVIKGGSHLCAANYCLRYRPAARQGEAIDTSTTHIGFRCVVRG
jgi:formylglycine-generating enzyme required for sulfatase activity